MPRNSEMKWFFLEHLQSYCLLKGTICDFFFLWRLNVVSVVHLSENETSILIRKLNEDNLVQFFYFLDAIAAFNQNLSF